MKKIKEWLPLWLILLYFGGIVFMIQNRGEIKSQYQTLVEQARSYAENDVVVDAIAAYQEALAIKPNAELAVEAGEVYLSHKEYSEAGKWYNNTLHADYPDQLETYEFGMRTFLEQDNYREAFRIYDEYKNRELVSDKVESMIAPLWYTFDLSGEYEEVRPFGNVSNVAAVSYNDSWGYIDIEGDRVLDYVYKSAGTFSEMGAVTDAEGNAYFTDSSGNKKITEKSILEKDPELGKVVQFLGIEGGRLWAYNGDFWNCYESETLRKLFGGYAGATNISNGIGAVKNNSSKWALIDADGTLLTEFLYDEAVTDPKDIFCRTDAVFVKSGEKYLLLDKKGKQIKEKAYEDACAFYDDTYAAVKVNGKWQFIDQKGKIQDIGTYDQARSFSGGLAAVCLNGKWGYIDMKGNLVIDCQFKEAGQFSSHGVAFVKPEGEEFWRMLTLYKDNHDR